MLQTRSSITLVAVVNTVAGGTIITILNSGGLYAMQSGAWNVGITNTLPGWQVKMDSTSIVNSAGWVVSIANTAGLSISVGSVSIVNSAGWTVGVGSTSIVNSAGWVVSIANTQGIVVASGSTNIINSAGWVVAQSNTAGMTVNVINSAGWAVFALDSAPTGTATTNIASTIGTVVLATAQVKRTNLSIYNASAQPMYFLTNSMSSPSNSIWFSFLSIRRNMMFNITTASLPVSLLISFKVKPILFIAMS